MASTNLTAVSVSSSHKGTGGLNSKVTTILSTSYSDADFRDALSLLDQRGIKNDPKVRRRIRLDLQKEVIDTNGAIIADFGRVAEQLTRIRSTLDRLNAGFDDMKRQVLSAHDQTRPTLAEATLLFQQRREIEVKREILDKFKNHFVMTDDELAALTLTGEPVDERFFSALAKAKEISKDCEVLLGFENQTLGTEVMEQASKNINHGFQKLYKWIQREFKMLNLENPQMNASIRKALRVLAERPSLFQNCLDFFSEARERILSDSFYLALTGTSSSGSTDRSVKPIDMTAHDPLRYVGDMLAWVHSSTVSEHEALEVLFVAEGEELAKGLKSGRDAELWRLVSDETGAQESDFNALKALDQLVDRDVSGAVRVLRQRVEQVIQSNEEIIPSYKLANLISFYRVTFLKLLGTESHLLDCVTSLEAEALRQFRALVRDHIATLHAEFQQTPSDLGPPAFLQDCLQQLGAIARTYDSSLSTSEDREKEFEEVLMEAFLPFMAGCENMAKSIDMPAAAVFLVNCKVTATHALTGFEFTQRQVQALRAAVKQDCENIVRDQYNFLRTKSGLDPLITEVETSSTISRGVLSQASHALDDFLPSALMDAMERLRHLQDSGLARELTEEAAEQFCQDFEHLENAVAEADSQAGQESGADGLRSVFPRTTAEIRVLLS